MSTKKKGFDFASYEASDEPSICELIAFDGEPLLDSNGDQITITVMGKDSAVYKKELRKNAGNLFMDKRGKKKELDMEKIDERAMKAVARATVSWSGIVVSVPLECSYEVALQFYKTQPEIYEQVTAFIEDRANFIKA